MSQPYKALSKFGKLCANYQAMSKPLPSLIPYWANLLQATKPLLSRIYIMNKSYVITKVIQHKHMIYPSTNHSKSRYNISKHNFTQKLSINIRNKIVIIVLRQLKDELDISTLPLSKSIKYLLNQGE